MADVQFVLCDVLCFLVNKFSKTSVKLLKSALGDFYSTEKLSAAKLQLISDVDKLNLPVKRPHIPHRRDGVARHVNEVEDIVTLFTFLDEQKAYDNLPTYVSDNPDNMPSLRVYEGDLLMLSTLLHNMEGRLNNFEAVMAAMSNDIRKLQVWPSLPEPDVRHQS